MGKKLRYGTGAGRHETMHDIGEYAAAAERYGFEHLTMLDDINLTRDVRGGASAFRTTEGDDDDQSVGVGGCGIMGLARANLTSAHR